MGRKTEEEAIAQAYVEEIEEGMYSSDKRKLTAKAGLIKCATVTGLKTSALYEKLFNSAAFAARATGAPILVHMDNSADALSIIAFFEKYGVRPEKIIICHLDRARFDYGYHEEVAGSGAYLEYDTIHREKYHSDKDEAALIEHMVKRGYADRLLLGMDTTNRRLKSYGADFGLDYILSVFSLVLLHAGKRIMEKLMIENPAKALGYK